MEIIIILVLVGGAIYLFMDNKKANKAKQPKKKVNKKRSTSQVKAKREVNDDK